MSTSFDEGGLGKVTGRNFTLPGARTSLDEGGCGKVLDRDITLVEKRVVHGCSHVNANSTSDESLHVMGRWDADEMLKIPLG